WTALFSISILLFLFRNVYVPLFGKQRLKVATVSRESHDTKDHWETRAGTSYLLTSNFSLLGQWHSEFGCGSGLRWQF
ncbi:MAG: hypothetical protein PF904_03945, partial [Kiritimatiellae bacterium]|nr:hypothetical protein [Kiritimatiellia bacterium]